MGFQLSGSQASGVGNQSTSAGPFTVVFAINEFHNGNFGGRSGFDTWVAARIPSNLAPFSPTNVHAFVSVSAADEIQDMPTLYGYNSAAPIYWWHNSKKALVKLATSWTDMLDGTILASERQGTGLTTSFVWTGSTSAGAVKVTAGSERTCVGWTSVSGMDYAAAGYAQTTAGGWLDTTIGFCSDTFAETERGICTVTFP